jgi:small subunit ribosomal protein S16
VAILSRTGDWQKFKGLPAPEPLKVAATRTSKTTTYEEEARAAAGLAEETRPRKAAKAAAAKPAAAAPAPAAPAPTAEEPTDAGTDAQA